MARHIAQIITAGAQAVGKAFAKALRQEIAASQAAASRAGGGVKGAEHSATNQKLRMTVEEAKQILNIENGDLDAEKINKNFEYLFQINEKAKGGSFYIQSKMMRNIWHSKYGLNALQNLVAPLTLSSCLPHHCANYTIGFTNHVKFYSSSNFALSWDTVISEENRKRFTVSSQKNIFTLSADNKEKDLKNVNSVLVPLCHAEGELGLLYTIRSRNLRTHKGQISFPGGRYDLSDKNVVVTALRETEEEIGLSRDKVDVWGPLQTQPLGKGGPWVAATLAYIGHVDENSFTLNNEEVESVFVLSLKYLCDPNNFGKTQFRTTLVDGGYSFPVFTGCQPVLWGLTARITHIALASLLLQLYPHKIRHVQPLKPK